MLSKLQNIDNRVIYILVLLAISIPLIKPIGIPVSISPITRNVYNTVDALPDGATLLIGIDYSPGASPQIHPQAKAVLNHVFYKKNIKVIFTSIATTGPMFVNQLIDQIEGHDKVYGTDYAHLGYLPGSETAISAFCKDFHKAYPEDNSGTPIGELPIMNNIKTAADLDAALIFTATEPSQYVRQLHGTYGVPLAVGVNSVIVSTNMPYVNSGQMFGLMNGLRGAAEYEALSGKPAEATASMDALSASQMVVLIFIVLGNIAWAASRKTKKEGVK